MSENRKVALETAHTFGHRDHRELLRTAMDIEAYLERGVRPALPNEQKVLRLQIGNEIIHDIFNAYHFNVIDEVAAHLKKYKKICTIPGNDQEVSFTIETETDADGNVELFFKGELKPLSNSKKK